MDDSVPIILIPNQTELKEIDPKQTCRLCLMSNEPDNLFDFYSSNNIIRQDISMVSLLSDCFKIEFHEDKDLPDRVCTNCATSILVVHAFRGNVLKCQELLNKHLDAVQQRKANIQVNPLEVENNHLDVVQQQESNIQLNLLEDEIYNDLQSEPEKDIPLLQVKSVHMLFDNGRESAKLCLPAALVDHDYLKPTVVVEPKVEWWSRKRKPPYICKICGTNYGVRYKSFYSHVRNHTGIKMPCEYCGKRFLRDNLRGHLRTHTNEKPFLCTQCPARFRIPRAFKDHMKVHTGEKSYMCEICGKAYIQSSSLSIHKFNKHGSKSSKSETPRRKKCEKQWPYYCEQCNKGFKSVIGLKCHLRLKSDTFCKSCCKDFSSTFNLRVHKLWHEIKLKESNISYFQKWICDICKMECNEAESLANHIITHMENWKIFNCANCDKNFTSKLSYNLHVKSHKGCRPYTCDICSNSFVLPGHLKRHLVIHAADKPHKCKICFKGFNQKSNLLSHMSTHGYTWLPE